MRNKKKIIIGVDEAGRGPLAGPIAVGAVAAVNRKWRIANRRILKEIKDSKKLSSKQREKWFEIITKNFEWHCAIVGPQIIDRIGISKAAKLTVARVLRKFDTRPPGSCIRVLLDGSLYAPKHYKQKTIIKGDEKIPLIAAASIVAKVLRDRKMRRLHKIFSGYCFDVHKGYGTKLHYKMIAKNGLSACHRRSFCRGLKKAV